MKEGIEIQMLPSRGVGKRSPGQVLVLYADDDEGNPYVVYHSPSSTADRKAIIKQAKLEFDARKNNGQIATNFRLESMSEEEAVKKGILPGVDRVDIPPRE